MKKSLPPNNHKQAEENDAVNAGEKQVDKRSDHSNEILPGKKFTDFLFEFILIFLAISGGFFANNLRENKIDRNKEKEYIASMIRDIEEDTASAQNIIFQLAVQIKGIDSLLRMMEDTASPISAGRFYTYCTRYLTTYSGFESRDITISQLRNSGGLRLIRDKTVLDSIIIYYSDLESHREQLDYNAMSFQAIIDLEIRSVDFKLLRMINIEPKLPEPPVIRELYNRILLMQSLIQGDHYWLQDVYKQGSSLLRFLKQEYDTEKKIKKARS